MNALTHPLSYYEHVISTRDLSGLPSIAELRRITKSLAMLDAIIEPQWDYRYYSFNSKWDLGEEMASMRNGQGDGWFCVFSDAGVFLKGFNHEVAMSPWNSDSEQVWPGVLDEVPEQFGRFKAEPAFSMNDTTFCIWRGKTDSQWHTGHIQFPPDEDPDGSERMLSILKGDPEDYREFTEWYFERQLPLQRIQDIYNHEPLTETLIRSLNPERDLISLAKDVEEIAYPATP